MDDHDQGLLSLNIFKGLYHKKVCLQIDPESYEWGLSGRSVDLK